MNHTAGPWEWSQFGNGTWHLATPHSGHLIVMDCVRSGMQRTEPRFALGADGDPRGRKGGLMYPMSKLPGDPSAHPDARLIASAPELLEALIRLDHFTFNERWATKGLDDDAQKVSDQVRAAIAKATTP